MMGFNTSSFARDKICPFNISCEAAEGAYGGMEGWDIIKKRLQRCCGKKEEVRMMVYCEGDIFRTPAQVIVNAVNTVGVMGKGIALAFKERYPAMFSEYRQFCDNGQFTMGKLMLWHGIDYWVLLFPTKISWREPSRLSYIEMGLKHFRESFEAKHIESVAFPQLGCGNGDLNWADVRPLMEKYLSDLPIPVYIYLRNQRTVMPEHKVPKDMERWLRENARDMSFSGLKEDIRHQSAIVPYGFKAGNDQIEVHWENGLVFTHGLDVKAVVDEKTLRSLWEQMREEKIFSAESVSEKDSLVYSLLEALGYISPIQLRTEGKAEMVRGYQMDGGAERYFNIEGRAS